jgi:hypothetical protein
MFFSLFLLPLLNPLILASVSRCLCDVVTLIYSISSATRILKTIDAALSFKVFSSLQSLPHWLKFAVPGLSFRDCLSSGD